MSRFHDCPDTLHHKVESVRKVSRPFSDKVSAAFKNQWRTRRTFSGHFSDESKKCPDFFALWIHLHFIESAVFNSVRRQGRTHPGLSRETRCPRPCWCPEEEKAPSVAVRTSQRETTEKPLGTAKREPEPCTGTVGARVGFFLPEAHRRADFMEPAGVAWSAPIASFAACLLGRERLGVRA